MASLVAVLKAHKLLKSTKVQKVSLFSANCYENYAFRRRHLASKKVAPNLNALMDWHQKLIDCNTVSDGYFDTLLAFVGAFFIKILDLEGPRPKTKGHTVVFMFILIGTSVPIDRQDGRDLRQDKSLNTVIQYVPNGRKTVQIHLFQLILAQNISKSGSPEK